MSQAAQGTSGLIRVTVASGTRRVDLVLPGAVPVAELIPELARSVGLLDSATVFGGYRLVGQDGRELAPDAGLVMQGVEDGGLLTVAAGVDDEAPRVYDDIVEAMADVVEHDLKPWEPATGRRTALGAAALLLTLGAAALVLQRGTLLPGAAAAVIALLLCVGAIVLARVQGEPESSVAVAQMGAGYGAVAGFLLAGDGPMLGLPLAAAGGGALLAAVCTLIGLTEGRALVLPPIVVGAIGLIGGAVLHTTDVGATTILVPLLVFVVIAGSVFPWLALSATGTDVEQVVTVADITNDPDDIEAERVRADARIAHEILVGLSATAGLLLVLVTPLAVSLGIFGTVLAVMCSLVIMLRTRQYRTGTEVLVGLVGGVGGLLAAALAVLWLHPEWRPVAAVVLAVVGAVLLAATLLPATPSVRRGRFGDVAETIALLTLLPFCLVALGVFDAIRG